jgi:hypothetical protein
MNFLGRLQGIGHESLSFLFRFAHKNLSILDPGSALTPAPQARLRPSIPQAPSIAFPSA